MNTILVINSGSSSIKYQLIDPETQGRLASGLIERIGQERGRVAHRFGDAEPEHETPIADHSAGFREMVAAFERSGHDVGALGIAAVGHRVVQGGEGFVAPTVIDEAVMRSIRELSALAPLHNPAHYQAIVAAREAFPEVPHVAVFDTAFHQTIPRDAYAYAIDQAVAREHGVRRYGFHGISYQVVAERTAAFLGRPVQALKQVVLHLGNGASACAIDGGRSVDTSMGMTPLEGLMMGTRSGDIDPGALLHLLREGFDAQRLDELLNHGSGLLGMAGSVDMRDVRAAAEGGDDAAQLALSVYVHRIRHYLGAYLLQLGGADAIVFTAGVGENGTALRAEVCAGLEWLGVRIDAARNEAQSGAARRISADDSRVEVLVVPTDEEAEIARQSWEIVRA